MARKESKTYFSQDVFAQRLQQTMQKRGLNQIELAKLIEARTGETMQRQTISQYMNARSHPDTARLTSIVNALGVSADYLLGLTDDPDPLPAATDELHLSYAAVQNIREIQAGEAYSSILNALLASADFPKLVESLWMAAYYDETAKNLRQSSPDAALDPATEGAIVREYARDKALNEAFSMLRESVLGIDDYSPAAKYARIERIVTGRPYNQEDYADIVAIVTSHNAAQEQAWKESL